MKNLICFFKGHLMTRVGVVSSYKLLYQCDRCGGHQLYDAMTTTFSNLKPTEIQKYQGLAREYAEKFKQK